MLTPAQKLLLDKAFDSQSNIDILEFTIAFEEDTQSSSLTDELDFLDTTKEKLIFLSKKFNYNFDPNEYIADVVEAIDKAETIQRVTGKDSIQTKQMFDVMISEDVRTFTADDLFTAYNAWGARTLKDWNVVPLTSVRRAINTLKENGYVTVLRMVDGPRGAKVSQYLLAKRLWDGVNPTTVLSHFQRVMKKKANLEANLISHNVPNLDKALLDLQNCLVLCAKSDSYLDLENKINAYNNRLNEILKGGKSA